MKSTVAPDFDDRRVGALLRLAQLPACDALHVRAGGVRVLDWMTERGRRPIETMSITKSVTSMVVGRLISAGLLDTIDRPAADFFPQWRDTEKEQITLRHILEHTSGLACRRTTEEIYASRDFVQHALDAELVSEPGKIFRYNNRAVNLLAEVVKQASGIRLDKYAGAELLGPLGIERWTWALDESGNPHCMAGLRLSATDLATIGQLMVQGGDWNGEHLLGSGWVQASVSPSAANAQHGLLWWLLGEYNVIIDKEVLDAWRTAVPPVPDQFIAALAPLYGRPLSRTDFLAKVRELLGGEQEWAARTWRRGLPDGRRVFVRVNGFYASGSGGQFLVVLPHEAIVAARMWAMEPPFNDVHPLFDALAGLPGPTEAALFLSHDQERINAEPPI